LPKIEYNLREIVKNLRYILQIANEESTDEILAKEARLE